jgi:hypothetical protein
MAQLESPGLRENAMRHKFSQSEDLHLRQLVETHGDNNWPLVASNMKGRTARQCRERFHNYLSPALTNGPWSREEELQLEVKFRELGPRWAEIARFFDGRSDVNVKNHYTAMTSRSKSNPPEPDPPDWPPAPKYYPYPTYMPYPAFLPYPPQIAMTPPYQMLPHVPIANPPPILRPPPKPTTRPLRPRPVRPPPPAREPPREIPPKMKSPELLFPKEPEDWTPADREDPLTFQFDNQFDTSYDLFM